VNENSGLFDKPSFVFGATADWYANEIRSNAELRDSLIAQGKSKMEATGTSLYQYEGVEFQIRQSKMNSLEWLVRFMTGFPPEKDGKNRCDHEPQKSQNEAGVDIAGLETMDSLEFIADSAYNKGYY